MTDHACQCGCLYCTPPDMTHGGNFGAGAPKPSSPGDGEYQIPRTERGQ